MKKFFSSLSQRLNTRFTFPLEGRFSFVFKSFSCREKQIFFTAMGVLVGTTIIILMGINRAYLVEIPARGGTLVEGVLNTPAHINPLLATGEIGSEADRDLSALIYSGLLRESGDNGFIPDLAESYTISPAGLVYTFVLRPNLVWHDGVKITASDVVFTIKSAQDSRNKSAKRASWDGVDVEQDGDLTVRFTLKKPYAPFLENATMGILPEHIWKNIDYNRFDANNYNRQPIGSGPYKIDAVKTITKDGDLVPLSYTLKAFDKFALGEPYIKTVTFIFYKNEEELTRALKNGDVNAINSIDPIVAKGLKEEGFTVIHTPLPRTLAVFLNQNGAPIFTDSTVRKALTLAIDKQGVIDRILAGYGAKLDSPLPSNTQEDVSINDSLSENDRVSASKKILSDAGWKFDDTKKLWTKKSKKDTQLLQFELTTGDATELKEVAQELKKSWGEIGVPIVVRTFATGDLKETIVRPRKFDALFFGQVLGHDGDPYPFWHSSQRIDPGLNIASYTNTRVDKVLESARTETDPVKRAGYYETFRTEIQKDMPAIFMYAPEFLYVTDDKIHNVSLGSIAVPAERFSNIYQWYIDTDNVWKIFAD